MVGGVGRGRWPGALVGGGVGVSAECSSAAVVTNTHDDTAGLQVIQSRNATDEAGNQTAFFTLALASELVIPATTIPHTSEA